MSVSFTRLGKFSSIISLNWFSFPFSLSVPGTPVIQILIDLILSLMSPK